MVQLHLHFSQSVQVHTNVTTESMSKYSSALSLRKHVCLFMSFTSFITIHRIASFYPFSDYNTSFYRNYKNNTSHEPH